MCGRLTLCFSVMLLSSASENSKLLGTFSLVISIAQAILDSSLDSFTAGLGL